MLLDAKSMSQITHYGEVCETLVTADETVLQVGQRFRLVSQTTVFVAVEISRVWKNSPTVVGETLDHRRVTKALLRDVVAL